MVVYPFNDNRITGVWTEFSTKWYSSALSNTALTNALETSLLVAVTSMVIWTPIALLAAPANIQCKSVRFRKPTDVVVNLPLMLPKIVLAVATLILFLLIGLQKGMAKLVIAHLAFCTPFA